MYWVCNPGILLVSDRRLPPRFPWLTQVSRYPETCGKTIEEIEQLFRKGAIPAWRTKKGGSRLEAEVRAVQEAQDKGTLDPIHETHMATLPEKAG